LTLKEWTTEWLERKAREWRPSTLERARRALSPLLEELGNQRLTQLSPLHLARCLEGLRERGLGLRTVQLAYAHLHTCLEEAKALGILAQNPLASIPRPRGERREGRDWRLEEMRRFLRAALEDGRPLALMLGLLLLTGLRPGEALGLRWEDVDLRAATLAVRRSVTWAGKEWHVGKPKSKSGERVLSLPSLALHLLERLPRDSVHLFWRERPPTPKQMSDLMRQLCEKASISPAPPHHLRHAHASALAALGMDVKTLQRRLGHASASVTLDVYAYALGEMDRRAAELVDRALGA
jgi:integrase